MPIGDRGSLHSLSNAELIPVLGIVGRSPAPKNSFEIVRDSLESMVYYNKTNKKQQRK